jgi:hypothetical protein
LVILTTGELRLPADRGSTVQGQPWQIVLRPPSPKITRAKWTGGVAQAVEYLLCQHKDLSSNFSPAKKKKEKRKVRSGSQ